MLGQGEPVCQYEYQSFSSGMDMLTQSIELSRAPHVVIATPGRLADHANSGDGLKLGKVKFLVSRLLQCGFVAFTHFSVVYLFRHRDFRQLLHFEMHGCYLLVNHKNM